jgi:trehalose 6-phosphate synthase/phosphatase
MPRCLLVSNRLPVAFNSKLNIFVQSSGGRVSASKGLDSNKVGFDSEWMGILTDDVKSEKLIELEKNPLGNIPCHPVTISKKMYDDYYNLYCNNVLWPLFHYERNMVRHKKSGWEAYVKVNRIMSEAIVAKIKTDDILWIHDFQLLLVPGFVKEKIPNLRMGFFLHIPFPSSEIFRELPERKEILKSLLSCDQIGFHDLSYLNHFRSSVHRILGHISGSEKMWGVYPISIDSEHFKLLANEIETKNFIEKYQENKKKMKWILGVDRLDYIKGLILKLKAFKLFLKEHPEERENVQFVQVVIPSRTEVPEYQNLKDKIEQIVSSINGEFGSPAWMPIYYLYHSVTENELSALYQLSEVLFIGSKRDGMNLVSLEYVMSQQSSHSGVILMSEFAGAHSTLSYAISINPWDTTDTAKKIKEALNHPETKRRKEIEAMKKFLEGYTSSDWAKAILRDLMWKPKDEDVSQFLPDDGKFLWMRELKGRRILFFCDLDGTLAPISPHPKDVRLPEQTIELLHAISDKKNCEFVVISGRDKEFMEEQFIDHDFNIPVAACHGAYVYIPKDHNWQGLIPNDPTNWKEKVMEIFNLYTKRTPESFIEDKGHAITWHYRNSPQDFADFLASKLFFELEETLSHDPVKVNRGKKVIEVKSMHANKGYFVQNWIQNLKLKPEIVVAIGDDTTDEDMFLSIQDRKDLRPYCIKIGNEKSHAHYFIKDQASVNIFLRNFLVSL